VILEGGDRIPRGWDRCRTIFFLTRIYRINWDFYLGLEGVGSGFHGMELLNYFMRISQRYKEHGGFWRRKGICFPKVSFRVLLYFIFLLEHQCPWMDEHRRNQGWWEAMKFRRTSNLDIFNLFTLSKSFFLYGQCSPNPPNVSIGNPSHSKLGS